MTLAALLLLADGRFPAGGHAHSGGVEVAVQRRQVVDVAGLETFLRGRLATAGAVDAALAAATCHRARRGEAIPWADLEAEAQARQPSPALRAASRAQGGQLLRAARRAWPGPVLDGLAEAGAAGMPLPVVLGACGAAAGCGPGHVAVAAAHQAVVGPANAAVRLLG
nr:urease accessory protein UreF [Actinomycetota bacterium]